MKNKDIDSFENIQIIITIFIGLMNFFNQFKINEFNIIISYRNFIKEMSISYQIRLSEIKKNQNLSILNLKSIINDNIQNNNFFESIPDSKKKVSLMKVRRIEKINNKYIKILFGYFKNISKDEIRFYRDYFSELYFTEKSIIKIENRLNNV